MPNSFKVPLQPEKDKLKKHPFEANSDMSQAAMEVEQPKETQNKSEKTIKSTLFEVIHGASQFYGPALAPAKKNELCLSKINWPKPFKSKIFKHLLSVVISEEFFNRCKDEILPRVQEQLESAKGNKNIAIENQTTQEKVSAKLVEVISPNRSEETTDVTLLGVIQEVSQFFDPASPPAKKNELCLTKINWPKPFKTKIPKHLLSVVISEEFFNRCRDEILPRVKEQLENAQGNKNIAIENHTTQEKVAAKLVEVILIVSPFVGKSSSSSEDLDYCVDMPDWPLKFHSAIPKHLLFVDLPYEAFNQCMQLLPIVQELMKDEKKFSMGMIDWPPEVRAGLPDNYLRAEIPEECYNVLLEFMPLAVEAVKNEEDAKKFAETIQKMNDSSK